MLSNRGCSGNSAPPVQGGDFRPSPVRRDGLRLPEGSRGAGRRRRGAGGGSGPWGAPSASRNSLVALTAGKFQLCLIEKLR